MDISVVVPVYNVERYLKKCLDSILDQEFEGRIEVICVNDGSTDNSLQILEEYSKSSSKIVLINQENKGLSAARNTGLKNSKGKYIMFIDSDDYLKNNKVLTLLYNEIVTNDLDFVIADFEFDYEDKEKNYRIQRSEEIKNKIMAGRDFYDLGIKSKSIMSVVGNKLYKTEFLVENNLSFYEGIIYEDMEFTPKAYYLASKVKYIDEVIYMYRQREDSITTSNVNAKKLNSYLIVADSLNQFNKEYNSKILYQSELYMYVELIRKLKYLDDKTEVAKIKSGLANRKIVDKFIKSSELKYKLFGVLYYLRLI